MKTNEQLQRDVVIMLNECKRHRDQKAELLQQLNKSLKYLYERKSIANSKIYELKKGITEDFHEEEIKFCEGEIKGIDSGICQLKKIKAFLKSYGI